MGGLIRKGKAKEKEGKVKKINAIIRQCKSKSIRKSVATAVKETRKNEREREKKTEIMIQKIKKQPAHGKLNRSQEGYTKDKRDA